MVALGPVGGEELAGLPGFELAPGFDFFDVGAVGNLAVGEFVAQLLVGGGAVAGELVDAEVFVEVFEVVFLDPAVEHEAHDFIDRALGIVGEDGELDGSAVGVGGSNNDLADGWVFGPGAVDVFEVIGPVVAGVVTLAAEGVEAVGACGAVLGGEDFPWGVVFCLIVFFPSDEVDVRVGEDLVEDVVAVNAAVHDEGEDALGTPLEAGAKPADEGKEAAAQVVEVIGAFEVDGVALGGVDVVAVDEFWFVRC